MLLQATSPRLPGVMILAADATGPQFRRWRRAIEAAFKAKKTWGHCDGSIPMPMPDSGPNFFSPVVSANPQPQLLEERRAWTKKDRDVKLDIFLSIADEIKLEVFEVGPPLPPAAMTSKEMMEALEEHFTDFKFEDYHHCFCHFLNLHIDQFPSLEAFNTEYLATLEDMLDHGYPMDNVQACSAYFSKLRCTQNPWVAKKLKEWDSLSEPPKLATLMKECPPWIIIRPLATKPSSQRSKPESYNEELVGEGSQASSSSSSSSEGEEEADDAATISSVGSAKEQEITVHASVEDLTGGTLPMPDGKINPSTVPPRLSSKKSVTNLAQLPPPINRPLPPLPAEATKSDSSSKKSSTETLLQVPTISSQRPSTESARVPALRPSTPQPRIKAPPLRLETPFSVPPTANMPPRPSTSYAPIATKSSTETFSTWPPLRESPIKLRERMNSSSSSVISLPLQGATIPIPEFGEFDLTRESGITLIGSGSPPRSLYSGHSRQSSWDPDDDEDKKKGRRKIPSWNLKAKLASRKEIKEII